MLFVERLCQVAKASGSAIVFVGATGLACPLGAHAGAMATTPELRQAAMAACPGDVIRLCPTVMFDEEKIFACMRANRMQLSPTCGAIFDKGAKTVRR